LWERDATSEATSLSSSPHLQSPCLLKIPTLVRPLILCGCPETRRHLLHSFPLLPANLPIPFLALLTDQDLVDRIHYSERYSDDLYEYRYASDFPGDESGRVSTKLAEVCFPRLSLQRRHVQLPRQMLKLGEYSYYLPARWCCLQSGCRRLVAASRSRDERF
jgi:hypothetical protein